MKKIIFLLFGFVLLISSCQKETPVQTQNPPDNAETEAAVLSELNYARTKPSEYAEVIRERRKAYDGEIYTTLDGQRYSMQEGYGAFDDAISALKQQKPLQAFISSKGLDAAAKYHCNDIGPKGIVSHNSSNGQRFDKRLAMFVDSIEYSYIGENIAYGNKNAREIVIQLILDDGQPERGHRKNIYTEQFNYVGVGLGAHAEYGYMCVNDFASNLKEKN